MILKYLLAFILFCSMELFSDNKIKANLYSNGFTHVKFMLQSPMLSEHEAKWRKEKQEYIKNIIIKADKKTVFSMLLSPYISKNPFFRFTYKTITANKLTLKYTDNYNVSKKITTKFKEKNRPYTLDTSKYKLITPQISMSDMIVPIHIISNIPLKSVKISTISNDTSTHRFVAKFFIQPRSIVDYRFKIKMDNTSTVQVIFEKEDGSLHTIENFVEYGCAVIDG